MIATAISILEKTDKISNIWHDEEIYMGIIMAGACQL